MSETQILTIVLATVPTFLVVLVGILINNSRLGDLSARMSERFDAGRRVNETNFKLILDKIEDVDSRLTRLEERFTR